jgi:methylmalonyl-CoA/ethylmalonyl-CoA epimerase
MPPQARILLRLHHIGYVVENIERAAPRFISSLGVEWDEVVFADPNQKVKVTFLKSEPGSPLIELVEPNAEDSPVNSFLRKNGPGLHHLCYEVKGLELAMAELRSKGALVAKSPKPAIAFRGRRIAWLLSTDKLLLELLEAENS